MDVPVVELAAENGTCLTWKPPQEPLQLLSIFEWTKMTERSRIMASRIAEVDQRALCTNEPRRIVS